MSIFGSSSGGPATPVGPQAGINPEYTDGAAPGSPWGPVAMTPTPNALGEGTGGPSKSGFSPSSEGPSLPPVPQGTGVEFPIGYPKR